MEGELENTIMTVWFNVGSVEDVDKDTNDRTFDIDELHDIMLMHEVVVNDNNALLVLEMI